MQEIFTCGQWLTASYCLDFRRANPISVTEKFKDKLLGRSYSCIRNEIWLLISKMLFSPSQKVCVLFFIIWFSVTAVGCRLNSASWPGGWGDRSCPRNATVIHSVAVNRTHNLPIEMRTPYCWTVARTRTCSKRKLKFVLFDFVLFFLVDIISHSVKPCLALSKT